MVGGANALSEMCHFPPSKTNTISDYLVVKSKVLLCVAFGTRIQYL